MVSKTKKRQSKRLNRNISLNSGDEVTNGEVSQTPFIKTLRLKTNSRIMLTYNLDVADGLSNGTTGKIVGFWKNESGEVSHIWVLFDDPNTGANLRLDQTHMKNKFNNKLVTAIGKATFQYQLGKAEKHDSTKAKVIQFPLTLAWAFTVHKSQGGTIKPPLSLVVDIDSLFGPGQLYVALGRIQRLSQLFITTKKKENIDKKIMTSTKTLMHTLEIEKLALNSPVRKSKNRWMTSNKNFIKITSLNLR